MMSLPDFNEKKIIVFFSKNGDKILFKNDNIIIKDEENNTKCQYTCYKLFILLIVGPFNITSGIVERANRFGFSIIFMNYSFRVYGAINCKMEGNTLLREKQYSCENINEISSKIIQNKIYNQKETLKKIRSKDNEIKETIKKIEGYIQRLDENDFNLTEEIMGIEGTSAKIYFKQLYKDYDWQGRQPRVKRDEINLLLDIGYTLLFNFIESIVNIYGFDIYKGILHKEFYKRKSLICDLIEPFRPIIDYKIRKMYALSQINRDDFLKDNGRYSLQWKNNSKYMELFIEEIIDNKSIIFNYVQSFYRWYMKGANIEQYPFIKLEE